MIASTRTQRRRLERLMWAAPHLQLVIVEREGDVVAAHPADRRDIEVVAAGKGYDIWVRPRGPIVEDNFKFGEGSVVLDRGLEPARFELTLRQAIAALGAPVHPVKDEVWGAVKDVIRVGKPS